MRSGSLLLLFALVPSQAGCLGLQSTTPAASRLSAAGGSPLIAPTKDDVALVDGRPFSLTGFLALRDHLKTRATEAVFWVGTAALAIQNSSRAAGSEVPASDAVEIARYALGEIGTDEASKSLHLYFAARESLPTPAQVRSELDRLLASSAVRRNDHVLAAMGKF